MQTTNLAVTHDELKVVMAMRQAAAARTAWTSHGDVHTQLWMQRTQAYFEKLTAVPEQGADVTVTEDLHASRINLARQIMLDARAAYERSPNAETEAWAIKAEQYMNEKLEARPRVRDKV